MSETAVKERGILFQDDMVRALLGGRKTQTRRAVKPQPDECVLSYYPGGLFAHELECNEAGIIYGYGFEDDQREWKCPYGKPGDRLWVREAWAPMPAHRPIADPSRYDGVPAFYRADNNRPMWAGSKWKPSIFMPRAASRITLLLTDVRVERVQDISEADAKAESLIQLPATGRWVLTPGAQYFGDAFSTHTAAWRALIEAHGREGIWERNDWVWALTFEVLK